MILVANQRSASSSAVRVLSTGDANIRHALGAIRRADAAADIMEVFVTLLIPERAPFLAFIELVDLTSTSAIGIGLVTVGTVVTEFAIMGAVLPADGSDTGVVLLTVRVAKSAILLLIISTR